MISIIFVNIQPPSNPMTMTNQPSQPFVQMRTIDSFVERADNYMITFYYKIRTKRGNFLYKGELIADEELTAMLHIQGIVSYLSKEIKEEFTYEMDIQPFTKKEYI